MPDYVEIKGLDELAKKLDNLTDLRKIVPALESGAKHIEGVVKEYPPASQANAPRAFKSFYSIATRKALNTWYQRGYGPRWVRKDGSWGGRKTSERLKSQWSVKARNHGLTQVIGNPVSYGRYVHGEEQARFHKQRGWKTIFDVVKDESDAILEFVRLRVDKILDDRI